MQFGVTRTNPGPEMTSSDDSCCCCCVPVVKLARWNPWLMTTPPIESPGVCGSCWSWWICSVASLSMSLCPEVWRIIPAGLTGYAWLLSRTNVFWICGCLCNLFWARRISLGSKWIILTWGDLVCVCWRIWKPCWLFWSGCGSMTQFLCASKISFNLDSSSLSKLFSCWANSIKI